VLTGGCASRTPPVPPRTPPAPSLAPEWRPVTLPTAGATVRALAACAGRWYAAGTATTGTTASGATPSGSADPGSADPGSSGSGPAAWSSADGTTWRPVPLTATMAYGTKGGFTSVACRGGGVVALSSASGGVHGNPRVSTWYGGPGGWTENEAEFEQFGGASAGSVDRVVSGAAGWLIVGHRVSPTTGQRGAAVWVSTDGRRFRLIDDDPALRSSGAVFTSANDAMPAPGGGWLLIGSTGSATRPAPALWRSPDGLAWQRGEVTTAGEAVPERILPFGPGGALAAGGGYAWLAKAADRDRLESTGGDTGAAGVDGQAVTALAGATTAAGETAFLAAGSRLVASADGVSWRAVAAPGPVRAAVGDGSRLLLAEGNGLWITDIATVRP
jgi:hypothetical protein